MKTRIYSEYRNVGVPWIAEIPKHWKVEPLFSVACERAESNKGMVEDNLLSLSYGRIIPKDISSNDGLLPVSFETYQISYPGDIVFRLTDLQNDQRSLRTAIAVEKGIITSAYTVVTPTGIFPSYMNYLLRAYDLSKVFYSMGGGLRQSMKFSDLKRLPLLIPSYEEQIAIATFLDRETTKIDALVEEQEKLIALLKEKRQAVISHAVTKGLDPAVPMKDSGIEWLGEVPEHWNVVPLKAVISTIESGTSVNAIDTPALQGELGVLKVSCVYSGRFDPSENKTVLPEEVERVSCIPRAGCLVVSRANTPELVGSAGLVQHDYEGLYLSDKLWQVHFTQVEAAFVHYWTLTRAYRGQVHLSCTGASSSMQNISIGQFRQFVFLKPPLLEQKAVVTFLNTETDKLDRLVNEAERAIELLKERRSALISAAVTGKIDVRGLVVEEVTA